MIFVVQYIISRDIDRDYKGDEDSLKVNPVKEKGRLKNLNTVFSSFSDGLWSGWDYTEKDEPQPQVVSAFGLRMTNCEPCRLSV